MARLAFRGVGEALSPPLMLGFPPSAERLVYEVRQKCRNIEGESKGALDADSPGRAGGLAPSGLPGAEAWLLSKVCMTWNISPQSQGQPACVPTSSLRHTHICLLVP